MVGMACSESPIFVMIKKTSSGYSFDNDVEYKSPFAIHKLTQETGMMHPSLIVKSNWGLNKNKSIVSMITGEAGAKILNSKTNRNITKNKLTNRGVITSKIGLLKNRGNGGYTLARFNRTGSGNAPSVAELASILNSLSKTPGNIKVRGSPLEYKRLLDYIQFIMTRKVSSDKQLYLARPNNVHLMDDIRDGTATLEDVYMDVFDAEDNNSTMYNRAYFVTFDRVAALASVIRDIPTLYQAGFSKNNPFSQSFFLIESSNNIRKLQDIIENDIINTSGFTLHTNNPPSVNGHSNRKRILLYNNKPVVTTGPLFKWFLDLRNVTSKTKDGKTRIIGSDFHKLSPENKAKILFYWAFNYPKPGIGGGQGNATIIEYFLSILDTFHDFTGERATKNFKAIWPEASNKTPYNKARSKTRNAITNTNIPTTSVGHKFLVDLLGIDIYRKAQNKQYSGNIVSTLKKTNSRNFDGQMKVAHFLFFITNIFGSQSSRQLINACEQYARDIMIKLAKNNPMSPSELCEKFKNSGACIVVDAISGSLPECMSKYSVYHNVGILDPATKGVLSWGQVTGDGQCIESAKEKARKKRKRRELQRRLKASKAKEEKLAKARATRNETKRRELMEKQILERRRQNRQNAQRRGRAERLNVRRQTAVKNTTKQTSTPNTLINKGKTPNSRVSTLSRNQVRATTSRQNNTQNGRKTRSGTLFGKPQTLNNNKSKNPNSRVSMSTLNRNQGRTTNTRTRTPSTQNRGTTRSGTRFGKSQNLKTNSPNRSNGAK